MRWEDLTIAIVGGDEREREIARLAAETGATVRTHGFPWPDGGIDGVVPAADPGAALRGAHYALFPVPGIAGDGSLFAPAAPAPIVPDEHLLAELAEGAHILLGKADARLAATAQAAGVRLVQYEDDQELTLLRGPAIVEGTLEIAFAETDVTVHAAEVAVVGHGNVGALLARALVLLGARVHVAARNPVQRAAAHAAGARALSLDELPELARHLAMLFSTVPARVIGRDVLERLPRGALVMDLAAPPGGVDLEAARELGHRAVWARGLGRRAPVTVGRSQWLGVRRRIEAIERRNE
jgi:dipicolinate synthase subunit A